MKLDFRLVSTIRTSPVSSAKAEAQEAPAALEPARRWLEPLVAVSLPNRVAGVECSSARSSLRHNMTNGCGIGAPFRGDARKDYGSFSSPEIASC